MSYTITQSPEQVLVTIQDELTVAHVRDFRQAMRTSMKDPRPVVVDCRNAGRIDISILQVLYSAQMQTHKLTFQECPAGLRDYLARAGVAVESWSARESSTPKSVIGECNG